MGRILSHIWFIFRSQFLSIWVAFLSRILAIDSHFSRIWDASESHYSHIWVKVVNSFMIKSDLKLIFPHCDTGLVIGNGILFVSALMTIWCSFDIAGRSWVKLKKYQKSLREQNTKKFGRPKFYRRSGANSNRSWRHRYYIQCGQTRFVKEQKSYVMSVYWAILKLV